MWGPKMGNTHIYIFNCLLFPNKDFLKDLLDGFGVIHLSISNDI